MSYIDLHNHCFAGMDDGVKTDEESLLMLNTALKSDIKLIYVTPHREPKGRYNPDNETVIQAWQHLKELASTHDLDIEIRYGEEFRIRTDSIELIKKNEVLGYMDTDYVLAEFTRTNAFSKLVMQAISAFQEQGRKILIAHPERYFDEVHEGVEYCRKWVSMGCYLQINRTSLLGVHGDYAEKIAHRLIKLGLAHVIASDAHEGKGVRVCRLDDAFFLVKKKYSLHEANMLFHTNPELLTQNKDLQSIKKPKKRLVLLPKLKIKKKTKASPTKGE